MPNKRQEIIDEMHYIVDVGNTPVAAGLLDDYYKAMRVVHHVLRSMQEYLSDEASV